MLDISGIQFVVTHINAISRMYKKIYLALLVSIFISSSFMSINKGDFKYENGLAFFLQESGLEYGYGPLSRFRTN